jgi:uncharacterized protein (TIGR03083 family)
VDGRLSAPRPIVVGPLFRQDRAALIALLTDLSPHEWTLPTVCAGWDVRDVALHVLGGDLGNISRRRDGVPAVEPRPDETLGALLARVNQQWVETARRLSPRLTVELLRMSGPLMADYFDTLEPNMLGGPVSWAGAGPAPVWLDVAREYMERWVHQQHIRDAVIRPGQAQARFSAPVIAASMHALPKALGAQAAEVGTRVGVGIEGDAGGEWSVIKEQDGWALFEGAAENARTTISLSGDVWWRVVTVGMTPNDAWRHARTHGDPILARAALAAVAIIA